MEEVWAGVFSEELLVELGEGVADGLFDWVSEELENGFRGGVRWYLGLVGELDREGAFELGDELGD